MFIRRQPLCRCLMLVILISGIGQADGEEPPVVAVVCNDLDNHPLNKAVTLLEVSLTKRADLKVVERLQLELVLRELELATATVDRQRQDAIKLGKTVGADLLVWVGETGQILILETQYGLRIAECVVDIQGAPDAKLSPIEAILNRAIEKLKTPIAHLVAVPSFHNKGFAFTLDHLRPAAAEIVAATLSDLPGVMILEIQQAREIAQELDIASRTRIEGQHVTPRLHFWDGQFELNDQGKFDFKLESRQGNLLESSAENKDIAQAEFATTLRTMARDLLSEISAQLAPEDIGANKRAAALLARAKDASFLGYYQDSYRLAWAAVLCDDDSDEALKYLPMAFASYMQNLYFSRDPTPKEIETRTKDALAVAPVLEKYVRRNHVTHTYQHAALDMVIFYLGPKDGSEMMLRLMRHKHEQGIVDNTYEAVTSCVQNFDTDPVMGQQAETLKFLLKVAPYWPHVKDYLPKYQGIDLMLLFNRCAREDTPQFREALKKLGDIDNAVCKKIAKEMTDNLNQGLSPSGQPWKPPQPTFSKPSWQPKLHKLDLSGHGITNWIKTEKPFDLVFGSSNLYDPLEGRLFRVDSPTETTFLIDVHAYFPSSVCFDGRYAWASIPNPDGPRVVAIEPETGKRFEFTAAHGLPASIVKHFAVAPIGIGDVVAVGHVTHDNVSRTWVARIQFDEETGGCQTKILHSAKGQKSGLDSQFWPRRITVYPSEAGPIAMIDRTDQLMMRIEVDSMKTSIVNTAFSSGFYIMAPPHSGPWRYFDKGRVEPARRHIYSLFEYDPATGKTEKLLDEVLHGASLIEDGKLYQVRSTGDWHITDLGLTSEAQPPLKEGMELEYHFYGLKRNLYQTQHFGIIFERCMELDPGYVIPNPGSLPKAAD